MNHGHHPDYDAVIHNHGASLLSPQGHAPPQHALAPHGQQPAPHGAAMVPLHEVHSVLSGVHEQLARMNANQQQRHAPLHARPASRHSDDHRHHHDDGYTEARERHDRREESREERPRMRRTEGPRQFALGFTREAIPPGATVEIEVKPQVAFKGNRLAVAASWARFFSILDIKVGKDSQLAATGELPAESYSSLAVGTRMELDRADPGIVIVLTVKNIDSNAQDFRAALNGEVWEE